MDWVRLLRRFGPNAPVLLAQLLLFQFAYPDHRLAVPDWAMDELWRRSRAQEGVPANLCRGTLLSREQYLVAVSQWGYHDAREMPYGRMTPQQIQEWTAAIAEDK